MIWHPLSIPKCSFLLRLALKNRLLAKDRLLSFGMVVDSRCVLCNQMNESIQHLMFECQYSLDMFNRSPMPLPLDWLHFSRGLANNVKSQVVFLFIGVAMHCIWLERNDRIHGKVPIASNSLASKAQQLVRDRVLAAPAFIKLLGMSLASLAHCIKFFNLLFEVVICF